MAVWKKNLYSNPLEPLTPIPHVLHIKERKMVAG